MSYKNFKKRLVLRELKNGINKGNREFAKMRKKELDEFALEELNVELDRRHTIPNMINQLITEIKGE
jgi:hypothetical protein